MLVKLQKKYIVVYRLGNPCKFNMKKIYDFANKKSLEVVYITGNCLYDKYPKTYASIEEWLCFIDNAEYVLTNSFHCAVFSLIFNKKFAIIPLSDPYKSMNTRLETLFDIFNIKPRWFAGDFSILDEPMNPILKAEKEYNIEEIF